MISATLPREYWFGLQWTETEQRPFGGPPGRSRWICRMGAERPALGWVWGKQLRHRRRGSVLRLARTGPTRSGLRGIQAHSAAACLAVHHPQETVLLLWAVAPGLLWFLVLEQGKVVEGSDCVLSQLGQVHALRQAMRTRYPRLRELRQPDDVWICLEQGSRTHTRMLRQSITRIGDTKKTFIRLFTLSLFLMMGVASVLSVGLRDQNSRGGSPDSPGFEISIEPSLHLQFTPRLDPAKSLVSASGPDLDDDPNPNPNLNSGSDSSSSVESDQEPDPAAASTGVLASVTSPGLLTVSAPLPAPTSALRAPSRQSATAGLELTSGQDAGRAFALLQQAAQPEERSAANLSIRDTSHQGRGWQLRHIDRRASFDAWECHSVWACLRQETEKKVGHARPSRVAESAPQSFRSESWASLKAIYGRDTRLLAEVQIGQRVLLFQQGQVWPVGRERDRQIRLLSLDSRCIELEFEPEAGQSLSPTSTPAPVPPPAQAQSRVQGQTPSNAHTQPHAVDQSQTQVREHGQTQAQEQTQARGAGHAPLRHQAGNYRNAQANTHSQPRQAMQSFRSGKLCLAAGSG